MVNVGVIGHTGRLGKPLVEILGKHPHADVVYTESRKEGVKGDPSKAELVFIALPSGESEKHLPKLEGKRVVDLSTDHRISEGWAYGLSELNRDQIRNAQRVASAGCYATSINLALAPLKGIISDVQVASTSGISGAGLEVEDKDNFLIYMEGRQHKHIPEIEKILGISGMLFVPQRIDTADRGIVSTIFARCVDADDVKELFKIYYADEPFVRITDSIETRNVNGTNFCDIKPAQYGNNLIIISALDNIVKGGSGQAIQNMNIMCGFEENTGL